jgi:uncharacterized protein (TIGR04255 family)
MNRPHLPEFDAPPAVETLMGFYFPSLAGWNILHFGQFWAQIREHYPNGSLLPPIVDPKEIAQGTLKLDQIPIRATFTDIANSELVQVQSSAFLRNWRRTDGNQDYTHYETLKPKFRADWDLFKEFLRANGIASPQVFQCEVTYVNHLVRGKDWVSYNELATLLKPIAPRASVSEGGRVYNYLGQAAALSLAGGYDIGGIALQVAIQSAVRQPDGTDVIQLTITAKAAPVVGALWESLDQCHDAVILAFDDVTTDVAHRMWRKHDTSGTSYDSR